MTSRQEAGLTWLLALLCLALSAWNVAPRLQVRQVAITTEQPEVVVSISGAVRMPGAYTLPWGSRLEDVITAAGGITEEAEPSLLNLAMPLDASSAVFVPYRMTDQGQTRISVNSASQSQLETLPGIGPALAQRIIAARPFNRLEDLIHVSGIGPTILERILPFITL